MTKRAVVRGCRRIAPIAAAAVVGACVTLGIEWRMLRELTKGQIG